MKKEKQKIIVLFLATLFFYSIIHDWENFKAGLMGKTPTQKEVSK